jgi:hypothetical protein
MQVEENEKTLLDIARKVHLGYFRPRNFGVWPSSRFPKMRGERVKLSWRHQRIPFGSIASSAASANQH